MTRHVVRLVAAVLVTVATGLGVSAPAEAATCGSAHGVTVVVDFHELGGGAQAACDAQGGGKAAVTQLTDVGHRLTYVQRQPGFVCRVDGTPDSDPCVNTPPSDAYWSLWWSDGRSGHWTYSSAGVGSLAVPDGGYVALSWQGSGDKAAPRIAPTVHASRPPTSAPTKHPSSAPPAGPTTPPATSSSPAEPTSSAAAGPTRTSSSTAGGRHQHTKGPSATPTTPGSASPAAEQATEPLDRSASDPGSGSGLPGWVAPVLVGALFLAAATVAVVRRKRSGGA